MRKRRSSTDRTTVDKFGRVLLPKPVRDRLGLGAGTRLVVRVEGRMVVLEAPAPEAKWVMEDGVPVWTGPIDTSVDTVELIRRTREERMVRLLKRALRR